MHTSSGHWPKFGSCIKTRWYRHTQHTQMPMVSEMRHPRGLDFETEREVVKMRDKGMSWDDIAESVTNLADEPSTADTVRRAFHRFNTKHGRSHYKFANCGRKSWKLTPAIQRWLINKLLPRAHHFIDAAKTDLSAAVSLAAVDDFVFEFCSHRCVQYSTRLNLFRGTCALQLGQPG